MKLSCQEHLLPGDGILEKWEFAQTAGFDGIELRGTEDWNGRLDDLRGARELGVPYVVDFNEKSPAEEIKRLSEGQGADVSVEISGSYPALHEAIRSTAYNSKVVSAGFFQGEGTGLSLGEEFHHNRIRVVCSQISGLSPALDHRWSVERLERTVMSLAAEGRISLESLVTHVFDADEAHEAFSLLDQRPAPGDVVQAVIKF